MEARMAKCRECDWEGREDSLERYRCPKCGSRRLKTEGRKLSQEGNLNPPPDADEGEDFSGSD